MVKSKTCRDVEILVRNLSPRLFGEKFWDSKKKQTMKKWDFKTYQKRFRDFEILPKFSETHIPFATPIILINDMHIFAFPLYPYYLKWWGWRKGTLIWRGGGGAFWYYGLEGGCLLEHCYLPEEIQFTLLTHLYQIA